MSIIYGKSIMIIKGWWLKSDEYEFADRLSGLVYGRMRIPLSWDELKKLVELLGYKCDDVRCRKHPNGKMEVCFMSCYMP